MNTHVQPGIQLAYARHQTRLRGLDLCKTLLELILNIQQHRGASLAVIGGDLFFETRIQSLEPHIKATLQKIDRDQNHFIDPVEWRKLYSEWFTVQRQWRQDTPIHNFELHTHLIHEVLKQIGHVTLRSGHGQHQLSHQHATDFVLMAVPQLMEAVGQLRACATHSAASGYCEPEFRIRLEYLCRDISDRFAQLDRFLEQQEAESLPLGRQRNALFDNLERWHHLMALIKTEVLSADPVQASPDAVFCGASLIISHLYSLIRAGIRLLRSSLDADLQAWIQASSYD